MTEREVWKEEYAQAISQSGRVAEVYHHVHPYHEGVAHCQPRVGLKMSTLVTTRPAVEKVCRKCWQRALFFEHENFRADGEHVSAEPRDGGKG